MNWFPDVIRDENISLNRHLRAENLTNENILCQILAVKPTFIFLL